MLFLNCCFTLYSKQRESSTWGVGSVMKVIDLEKQIDLFSYISKSYHLKKSGRGKYYFIEPCPVCGHKDHFAVVPSTNSFVSFSNCCTGGGPYKYLISVEGLAPNEAYKKLCDLAGIALPETDVTEDRLNEYRETQKQPPLIQQVDNQQNLNEFVSQNFITFIHRYANEWWDFQKQRYISNDNLINHQIFIYKFTDGLRIVFPVKKQGQIISYSARALEGQEPRYLNSVGPKVEGDFFGVDVLESDSKEPIILVEGQIDKLNLEAMGFRSISINGTQNYPAFIDYVKKTGHYDTEIFINGFDNDIAGDKLCENSFFKRLAIPKQFSDINEWYVHSINELTEEMKAQGSLEYTLSESSIYKSIAKQLYNPSRKDNVLDYLMGDYQKDLTAFDDWRSTKTGFHNIDKHIKNVEPGLYVIGGVPSIGKTTFLLQLANGLIHNSDRDVILYSLEQKKVELVKKELNRIQNLNKSLKTMEDTMIAYAPVAARFSIVEGGFNTTVTYIREYLEHFIRMNKKAPVIMIDYLQILGSENELMNDKMKVDRNVIALKQLSKDLQVPVFLISSLNRANYTEVLSFESFKESGSIEYCADHVWGIQLDLVNEISNKSSLTISQKRKKLNDEKAKEIRNVELLSLKGRNVIASFSAKFKYHAKQDYFKEM